MSVRFVIGQAGSGKTRRCFDRIVKELRADPLGPPIFWIVPKQETFQAQRTLACQSGLGGFVRVHVVSFDLLGRQILADCGGAATPEVTAYGRQMILGLILRKQQDELEFFKSSARQPGLAAKLDATFAELERCGKGLGDLADLMNDLDRDQGGESPPLRSKTHDLHRIYKAYCEYLGQERLDGHRRLGEVLGCIERCSMLKGALVLVDGFLDFTHNERLMLAAMAKVCGDLEITIHGNPEDPIFKDAHRMPDEMGVFYRTQSAYRKLYFALTGENIAIDAPVLLPGARVAWASTLARALEGRGVAPEPAADIEFWEAKDTRAEVDCAAARIHSLVAGGLRYRDVMALMRDAEAYADLIDASFREHGIPFFIDRRRTAGHHPLLQFTRAALAITQKGYGHDAMMMLIKSDLAGLTRDQADELENYVLMHRIRGPIWTQPEPWGLRRRKTLGEDCDPQHTIDAQRTDQYRRKVIERLDPFVQKLRAAPRMTVREAIVELFKLFRAFGVQATIQQWMQRATQQKQLEQAGEHEQLWNELANLFDQMAELVGDEQVNIEEFADILESGLERFDLALTPPTVDQVLVGQIDRRRSPGAAVAIVLGLSEGRFPGIVREDSILSDADRRELRQRTIDIESDSQRQMLNENLLGYIAFTRASQKLIVTRPAADDAGRPLAPSIFWRELRGLCPASDIKIPAEDDIQTPRHLVTRLMQWVRQPTPQSSTLPPLYNWLASYKSRDDAIDRMRSRAWKALSYENCAALSADAAGKLWKSPLSASVSQLESFAACPFKHFVQYGLALQERDEQDPTAIDMGNVYHETLDKLVRCVLKQKLSWKDLPPATARTLIATCAQEVGENLRDELMMSSARNRYLLEGIKKTLEQVASAQSAMAQRGRFIPAYTELAFGLGSSPLPPLLVHTPAGNELRLRGKIDRVDLAAKDDAFAIIDYKMREKRLSLEQVYHGLSLQLLTYLLVLQAHGEALTGKSLTPAAGLYMKLLRELESVDHPSQSIDPSEPAFVLKARLRGIVDMKYLPAFDPAATPGKASEVLKAYIKKDGTPGATGDLARPQELWALLGHVNDKLGEIADRIIDGNIDIRPFKLRQITPCPNCSYRDICRFEIGLNHYLPVKSLDKSEVLALVDGGADGS